MKRTKQTAEYITEIGHIIDDRLNDINGWHDGGKVSDYHEWVDATPDRYTAKMPHKESSEDVYKRANDFLAWLGNKPYENVLIVTSKHVFRHIRSIIHRADPRNGLRMPVDNGEILEFELK